MIFAIVQLIILLLVLGLLCWGVLELIKIVPLPPPFGRVITILIYLLAGLVVVFYGIIPLLHAIPNAV